MRTLSHVNNMIKYLLFNPISIINFHGSFEIFTNPTNLVTHLMVNSLKKVEGKQLSAKSRNFIGQFFFSHLITSAFVTTIYSHKSS